MDYSCSHGNVRAPAGDAEKREKFWPSTAFHLGLFVHEVRHLFAACIKKIFCKNGKLQYQHDSTIVIFAESPGSGPMEVTTDIPTANRPSLDRPSK